MWGFLVFQYCVSIRLMEICVSGELWRTSIHQQNHVCVFSLLLCFHQLSRYCQAKVGAGCARSMWHSNLHIRGCVHQVAALYHDSVDKGQQCNCLQVVAGWWWCCCYWGRWCSQCQHEMPMCNAWGRGWACLAGCRWSASWLPVGWMIAGSCSVVI